MIRRWTTRPQRALLTLAVGLLVLALAACGSNLNPEDVNRASGSGEGGAGAAGDGGTAAGGGDAAGGADGAGGTGGSADGSTGGGGGAADGGSGGSGSGGATEGNAPVDPKVKAGSCDGFKNGPGITQDSITIGNASDISGPVPGLFETAQDATKAFVSYFNAAVPDGICGRKLVLKTYDSKTDASADQQAYAAACDEVFAMVGSVSAFDLGGAKTAQGCGLPDLRGGSVTFERNACTTCFGVQAVNTSFFQNAVPDFVRKTYGSSAAGKAAFLYTDAGAAAQNAKAQVTAMERRGMDFDYVQGIPTGEINYTSYVQKMKEKGIEVVFFTTSYQFSARMRQTMKQQQFEPKLYLRDPTDYNPDYVEQSNGAADGTVVFTNFAPFEEAGSNRELATYLGALQQSDPGADPQFFGVFAWSAARLFVQLATQLGGGLTRASLVAATKKTNDWTANGLHAPQPVGSKGTGECWRFIQLDGESWKPVGGTKYSCTGLTSTR